MCCGSFAGSLCVFRACECSLSALALEINALERLEKYFLRFMFIYFIPKINLLQKFTNMFAVHDCG